MIYKCLSLFNLLPTSMPHIWLIAADWLEEEGLDVTASVFRENKFRLEIEDIKDFLFDSGFGFGFGDGDGDGDGYGGGDGWGNGITDGSGFGNADGVGWGNAHGFGDGSGHGNGFGDSGMEMAIAMAEAMHMEDGIKINNISLIDMSMFIVAMVVVMVMIIKAVIAEAVVMTMKMGKIK
jgi:hypothetical protein